MPGPIRTRQSCDRCHSHKLKCPKQIGSVVCERCARAGTACVFSPAGTRIDGAAAMGNATWRPQQPSQMHQDQLPLGFGAIGSRTGTETGTGTGTGTGSAPAFDWSFLEDNYNLNPADLRASTPSFFGDILRPTQNHLGAEESSPSGDDSPVSAPPEFTPPSGLKVPEGVADTPRLQTSRNLSGVLHELDWVWAACPDRRDVHAPNDGNLRPFAELVAQRYANRNLLEVILRVVQRLIDVYVPAVDQSLPHDKGPAEPCEVENCIHNMELPPNLIEIENAIRSRESPAVIDFSLANLLIASHLRLIDVLDRMFVLMMSCFRITLASTDRKSEPEFDVPLLKVGSFVPKRSAAVFMQAFLMKHFLGVLQDHVEYLSKAVATKAKEEGASAKECRALELQCEILKERHDAKLEQVHYIAEELTRIGLIK